MVTVVGSHYFQRKSFRTEYYRNMRYVLTLFYYGRELCAADIVHHYIQQDQRVRREVERQRLLRAQRRIHCKPLDLKVKPQSLAQSLLIVHYKYSFSIAHNAWFVFRPQRYIIFLACILLL